jgi:hypothetical protein
MINLKNHYLKVNSINPVLMTPKNSSNPLATSLKDQFKSNPLKSKPINIDKEEYHSTKLEHHINIGSNSPQGKLNPKITKTNSKKSASNSVGKKVQVTISKGKFNTNQNQPNVLTTDTNESIKQENSRKLRNKKQSSSIVQTNVVTTNFTEKENTKIDVSNYATNKEKINISENETENILTHIDKLRFLFKSNELNMAKLMKNEQNQKQLNELNQMLNSVTPVKYSDKKINVINSNMLSNDYLCNKVTISSETATNENKEVKNEIYTNSDMRIKKYGILFDFINTNLKEINHFMSNKNEIKVDEMHSKLSSLHSKINLNSLLLENKEYDYEDSEMHEFANIAIKSKPNYVPFKNNEIINSLLISSINSDFYQDLVDCSFHNVQSFILGNISNDMSIRTINDRFKEKLFDPDQTQLIYNKNILEEKPRYEEGEENIESDSDRTKENINIGEYRVPYNQVIKDIERKKVNIYNS